MSRITDSLRLPDPGERAWAGVGAGLAVVAIFLTVDAAAGADIVIVTAYLLGAFVTALIGTPRETVAVVCLTTLLAVASGAWNENFGEVDYFVRAAIVAVGGGLAVVGALGRQGEYVVRKRFALLVAAARVVDDELTLEETVERLNGIIVPAFADVCIFDITRASRLERLSVRASGPAADRIQECLRERTPSPIVDAPSSRAALIESDLEGDFQDLARREPDSELLGSIAAASSIAAPLRARGRTLGTITFIITADSGRRYGPDELEFSEVLAGRAALALDNAGLFSELASMEAQLTAALGSLAEAVTVQARTGELIYANRAAAEALGFESAEELRATTPREILSHFEAFREDGSPLRVEDLPGHRVLAGEDAEPLAIRAIDKRTGEERWRITKATAVRNARGEVELAVNIIEDVTEVKRAEMAQRLLADAGDVLASSLDYGQTLQRVAEMAVPELADWCGVSMPDGHGLIRQVAVAHVDPAKIALAQQLSERYPQRDDDPTGAAAVIRDGRPLVFNEIPDQLIVEMARDAEHLELIRGLGLHAGMVVPMKTGRGMVGALTLVTAESGRTFSEGDVELAEELARRAAIAVENARLYTERSHIARTLQRGLLPPRLPDMPGWASATLYRAAGQENWVGGDFYDAFPVEGGWMVVVGDVAGHGPEAAALTGQARYTLRTTAMLTGSPIAALDQLNRELVTTDPGMALCTAACVLLREVEGEGRAQVVCAGHPLPLVVRKGGVEAIGRFGPMLGAWGDKTWTPVDVAIDPGDTLVLYTDGVVDAEGADDRFGEQRLEAVLAGARDADEVVGRIDRALSDFEVGDQADDTAVLAVSKVTV
ncbi:MAG: SpoIIE family protein phosphatase, partial [Actinomycetota bacterium]|nr:SpoIIE family protein phosphatase [Actinomycetota bacterium]